MTRLSPSYLHVAGREEVEARRNQQPHAVVMISVAASAHSLAPFPANSRSAVSTSRSSLDSPTSGLAGISVCGDTHPASRGFHQPPTATNQQPRGHVRGDTHIRGPPNTSVGIRARLRERDFGLNNIPSAPDSHLFAALRELLLVRVRAILRAAAYGKQPLGKQPSGTSRFGLKK